MGHAIDFGQSTSVKKSAMQKSLLTLAVCRSPGGARLLQLGDRATGIFAGNRSQAIPQGLMVAEG
jgi:hypothetical protein